MAIMSGASTFFQSKAGIVLGFADASPAFGIAIAGH